MPRKKQESPPWKKIIAEGPSSFTQDGIRKSGRTNQVPFELQPPSDKRQTRGAVQKTYLTKSNDAAGKSLSPSGTQGSAAVKVKSLRRSRISPGKNEVQIGTKSSTKSSTSPKRSLRNSTTNDPPLTPTRSYKRASQAESGALPYQARRTRRASEVRPATISNGFQSPESPEDPSRPCTAKVPRIRFRVKPPTLPIVHPEMILRRPKLYSSFEEYVEKAGEVAIEAGGLLAPDDDTKYTMEMAAKDAALIIRMEDAAKDGGVLSPGVSSVYRPDELDRDRRNPLKQYAHQDHVVRAVIEFRLLMLEEHKKHKRTAKRMADACRDEWNRKQPKTQQEIEAEAIKIAEGRYRFLVKSLQATWDNVKAEVNRRRVREWEAEEQIRVRKALNDAVDISTQKLEARRAFRDSEALSEGPNSGLSDVDHDNTDSTIGGSDSNMSSSDSEAEDELVEEAAEDEHLTVEELRQKYANLLEPPTAIGSTDDLEESEQDEVSGSEAESIGDDIHPSAPSMNDESDESIDMDDDMGSSDDDRFSGGEEDDGAEGGEDEDGESGLLGFLAPSDLDSLGLNRSKLSLLPANDDIVDEDDEVSLIPDASPAHRPPTPITNGHTQVTNPNIFVQSLTSNSEDRSPETDIEVASGDRSSQPTPRTTESKPSEVDSASSIEVHQSSRYIMNGSTSQPATNLKTPIPFLLRGTLREYQHYGLDWLAGLYANNTNGILADEMGLGKTIQTIALLAHLACEHQVWGPHLVVVPTSVMLNWEMEFKKWCPGFKILTYYGTQEERKKKRQGWSNVDAWNVCITSYQLVLHDQQAFKRKRWHYMILDEAHNIKNFRSQRWQTLLTFNTRARLLLTGTPLQNNLTELWSLLFFLMPSDGTESGIGGFVDLKEFSDWFRKPQEQILENGRETMDDEARAIISKLHKVLRPYLLRRMKADVEKQMPGKYEHVEYCRLSRRQRELYDGFLSRSDTRGTLASGNYLSIINCLMQLRKVCNHPDLFQERPILSSFPMKRSIVADYEIKEFLIRRRLLREDPMSAVRLEFLNLVPTRYEKHSGAITERSSMLTAQRILMDMREAQRIRAQYALMPVDYSTIKSNLSYLESASRWSRFEELQHCVYLNALRRQQKPIYGSQLIETLNFGVNNRPFQQKPNKPDQVLNWIEKSSSILKELVPTLEQRAKSYETTIQKFACITPPIVAPDALPFVLSPRVVEYFQNAPERDKPDPFHEARIRLSVQFPDKRLLQYDCGKLQTLDKLLRKLQSGGHRALIFTQMTKVLDILEQFLNIHGHRYLRLDGATKIEQRQILTDRFNNDTRILAFILSSRSGGLGINLTGADTVIFYDLDWNPAMDKQCQDRCHRIGQTRDVHIYRLVSEHTIEANILRKANQKRMLDDVVIKEGEFTTDYFNKMSVRDVLGEEAVLLDGDAAANAAMDRVLGGPGVSSDVQRVLEQAEDQEDVIAAKVAQQEVVQADAADFDERLGAAVVTPRTTGLGTPIEGVSTPITSASLYPGASIHPNLEAAESSLGEPVDSGEEELNCWGMPIKSTDDYMLRLMTMLLKDTPLELPKDKIKSKKARDLRHRSTRGR